METIREGNLFDGRLLRRAKGLVQGFENADIDLRSTSVGRDVTLYGQKIVLRIGETQHELERVELPRGLSKEEMKALQHQWILYEVDHTYKGGGTVLMEWEYRLTILDGSDPGAVLGVHILETPRNFSYRPIPNGHRKTL